MSLRLFAGYWLNWLQLPDELKMTAASLERPLLTSSQDASEQTDAQKTPPTLPHCDIRHTMRAFSGDAWALRGTKRVSLGVLFVLGAFLGISKKPPRSISQ